MTAIVCVALIALGWATHTVVPGHAVLRAQSAGVFMKAFAQCLAWPWSLLPAAALVIYAPFVAFAWSWLKRGKADASEQWRSRGLWLVLIWVIAQAAAVAAREKYCDT